jgi:phosphoenolpyruvate synthase/pyruvate phosphate dikinase
MFGDVVMGVDHDYFEAAIDKIKKKAKVELDTDLPAEDLKAVSRAYKKVYKKHGQDFPQDPRHGAARLAINAVFGSWNIPRAKRYRKINDITGLLGTAVNVQAMVFGNMGDDCGTGVCFTRNPSTGENKFYGEFLMNAQGEDVVAGIRTPQPIARSSSKFTPRSTSSSWRSRTNPREALQGHAGHRVHHRGRQALHPPDPQRQAHRPAAVKSRWTWSTRALIEKETAALMR